MKNKTAWIIFSVIVLIALSALGAVKAGVFKAEGDIYRNQDFGFRFEYPSDWKPVSEGVFQSEDYRSVLVNEVYELSEGGQIITFSQRPSPFKTLAELEGFYASGTDGPKLEKEGERSLGNEKGLLYSYTGNGGFKGYVAAALHNDLWVGIGVQHKDPKQAKKVLENVLDTFRFTE